MDILIDEPIMLFGGYVESINLSTGWGTQSSTAQISLVYEDDGPNSNEDYSKNFPQQGSVVGIKIGQLEFAGIFQRYTHDKATSGYKYDIVLESPSKALDGVNVILNSFQGSNYFGMGTFTNQVHNVWNPFAILENYEFGGIFGGSDVNSAGFPGYTLFNLMESISRGEKPFGGPIHYGETYFELDLTEVKAALSKISGYEYYRIKGDSHTISSIIDEVCSIIMHDYIVQVLPKNGGMPNGLISEAVIRLRLIDRARPPDLGIIKEIVKNYEDKGQLIRASVGQELNDAVTQKVVVGGPADRYFLADNAVLTPIFGRTKGIKPEYVSRIVLENGNLYPEDPDEPIETMELRCAAHSMDSWILYHYIRKVSGQSHSTIDKYFPNLFTNIRFDQGTFDRIINGNLVGIDLLDTRLKKGKELNGRLVSENLKSEYAIIESIYNSVKNSAEEYWGKKYFVSLPSEPGGLPNNLKFVFEDMKVINSWEIADSAWFEPPGYTMDVSFFDGDGKLKPTAAWEFGEEINYSNLGNGYAFTKDNNIASVINIEKDIRYFNGSPVCVIETPAVDWLDGYTTEMFGLRALIEYFFPDNEVLLQGIYKLYNLTADTGVNTYGVAPERLDPRIVGIPQVSTRYRYGPWWNFKAKNGKSELIIDDSISPATFGGYSNMTSVAQTYSAVINAEISGRETGNIEIAGMPHTNIANKFLNSGPYVTGMDISISTDGIKTNYKFNTWTPEFGKMAKANIDRFANFNKSLNAFKQDQRSKLELRPFKPPQYREKWWTNRGRMSLLAMGGQALLSGVLLPDEDKKNDPDKKKNKKRTIVNGGAVQNQVPGIVKDFPNSYACSQEQLFTPVAVSKNKPAIQNGKPVFQMPKKHSEETIEVPTSETYDPYHSQENDFNIVVHGEKADDNVDLNLKRNEKKPEDVRTLGLRTPILISGWGYGYDLKKAPYVEGDPKSYPEDIGQNRNLWKTGPLDVKWDEKRKVWGAGYDFVEGVLQTDVVRAPSFDNPTDFMVAVYKNKTEYDYDDDDDPNSFPMGSDVQIVLDGTVRGYNRDTSLSIPAGTYVILMRINYEWRIIYSAC